MMLTGSTNSVRTGNQVCNSLNEQFITITLGPTTFTSKQSSKLIDSLGYFEKKRCLHFINKNEVCINFSYEKKKNFEAIIELSDKGNVVINDENLIQLLNAANYLECEKAKTTISYYIFRKLNLKNYLFYFKISKLYNLKYLAKYFCNYLLQQYILNEDKSSFYELQFEDMFLMFSCSELQVSSELELFNAAVDWINYKPNERTKHMNTFLKLIRLPLISNTILNDLIKEHEICKTSKSCRLTVEEAIKSKNTDQNKASNIQFQNRFYHCLFESKQIMLVGGMQSGRFSELKVEKNDACFYFINDFNSKKPITTSVTTSKMQEHRNVCKTVVIGSKIYCFGGLDSNRREVQSSEVYCRKSNTWSLIAPFPCSHLEFCCVCSFMNKIYVFGDIFGCNYVYDPVENYWTTLINCIIKRYSASCSVFEGQCVVIGGRQPKNYFGKLKSVEKYDHYLNKWSFLANMQTAKSGAGVVTRGNKLFVISGSFEDNCEVYDTISKKFVYIAKYLNGRFDAFDTIIIDNCIVVYQEGTIYKYDINRDKWFERDYRDLNSELRYSCSFIKVHKLLN